LAAPAPVTTAPEPARAAPGAPGAHAPGPGTGPPDGGAAAAAKLPPARSLDEVLRDNIKALGGADAMSRHRSLHTKMAITFQGLGITATAEHYAASRDRALTVTTIPNLASTREGTDGHTAWSQDPINGLRLLGEAEAEQARIENAWNAELRVKELYATVEVKNEPGEGGAPYFECLVLTPKASPAMTECFDPRTHLLARQRGVRSSPQGNTPFLAHLRDWRAVGDLKMPFVTDMQVGPLSFVGTITSAELDVPVDPSLFAVPDVAASPGGGGGGGRAATGAVRSRASSAKKESHPPGPGNRPLTRPAARDAATSPGAIP
jgi:hypothetical protein